MKARTRRRTASSRGSNQSPPAKGDGDMAAADVASVMAWVPSRSCRSEPTPPQLFPTNLALRSALAHVGLSPHSGYRAAGHARPAGALSRGRLRTRSVQRAVTPSRELGEWLVPLSPPRYPVLERDRRDGAMTDFPR